MQRESVCACMHRVLCRYTKLFFPPALISQSMTDANLVRSSIVRFINADPEGLVIKDTTAAEGIQERLCNVTHCQLLSRPGASSNQG